MDVLFQYFFFKIKKNILLLGRLMASLSSCVFKFLGFYTLTLSLHSFGVVMFSRLFFVRTTFVVLVAAAVAGCASNTSYSSTALLDCNDGYTRCAPKVEPVKKKPAADIVIDNSVQLASVEPVVNRITVPVVVSALFGFDEATVGGIELGDIIAFLIAHPAAELTLHGYTDPIGREDYNRALSYRRAAYVRERLLIAGVSAKQLKVVAHGENNLIVPAVSPDWTGSREALIKLYAANRRVEFEFFVPNIPTSSN